jgi:hypothetical protein
MAIAPITYSIKVDFVDNEIVAITRVSTGSADVPGTGLNSGDINKYKKSAYGLRYIESVSYTQQEEPLSEEISTLATNCYTVIGGFKVKVPCS